MNEKKQIKSFFNKGSHNYLKFKYKINTRNYISVRRSQMIDMIDKYIPSLKFDNHLALDGGCGPGLFLADLINLGFKVSGIDMSQEMLKIARKNLSNKHKCQFLSLVNGDIEELPFKNCTFKLICSAGVIEYLENDTAVLSEFRRILEDNGYLMISVTNKYAYNLIFDKILEIIKRQKFAISGIERVKNKLFKLGPIRQREFVIRKHSPLKFKTLLEQHGFRIVHSRFFYCNLFPNPFNIFLQGINDYFANRWDKLEASKRAFWGEGYLILCQKTD